ncbi:MAG: hypothetical protein JW841_06595 [Deltaproteobacteria bacterium]|nr:hypothetical protein [Deltaproteobacteria bacterium]
MMTRKLIVVSFSLALALCLPTLVKANASGVGLGVAIGGAYSGTEVSRANVRESVGVRPAWGFFVDIPLLQTFYISPAAMLYTFEDINGDGKDDAVTDVDINFKFIVPVGTLHFGAGVTAGLTSGVQDSYAYHYGALGFASVNLVANLDVFFLAQYKHLVLEDITDIEDWHGFVGGMFHF